MNTTKRKAIALARVSTDSQDTKRQLEELPRIAAAHGLEIERVVCLDGVSGRRVLDDEQFKSVLRDLGRDDISGVIVCALDRLIRIDAFGDFSVFDSFKKHRKLLYSGREGIVDVSADAGFLLSLITGAASGLEWRVLRERTASGKSVLRRQGKHVDGGAQTLPKAIAYDKETGKWSYREPEAERMRKAYDLLFEHRSWSDIVERIGGNWTTVGLRGALQNPLFKGVRKFRSGDETFELQVIDQPLISVAQWEMAQRVILERHKRWQKTKGPPSHWLLNGLLVCKCGAPCYVRCPTPKAGGYYYCSTAFPGRGPKCGMRTVQREAAEQAVSEIVTRYLTDAAFLKSVLAATPNQSREVEKLAKSRGKLEAERRKLLQMTLKSLCSEADYTRESKRIDAELRDLDRLLPPSVPVGVDAARFVAHLTRKFARFSHRPRAERRELLRAIFREVILENGTITSVKVAGSLFANSEARCSVS